MDGFDSKIEKIRGLKYEDIDDDSLSSLEDIVNVLEFSRKNFSAHKFFMHDDFNFPDEKDPLIKHLKILNQTFIEIIMSFIHLNAIKKISQDEDKENNKGD